MTIEDLAREVESLKAENRRLKRWGAGILILGLAMAGMAMAQEEKVPEVVRARRFEVVATGGAHLAAFGAQEDGWVGMTVLNKDSGVAVSLGKPKDDDPRLFLARVDSPIRSNIVLSAGRLGATLNLASQGKLVSIGVPPQGTPCLKLLDRRAEPCSLWVDKDGVPHLDMTDKDGKTLFKVPE